MSENITRGDICVLTQCSISLIVNSQLSVYHLPPPTYIFNIYIPMHKSHIIALWHYDTYYDKLINIDDII